MSNSDRIIADRTLTDFARDLFSAAGVPPEDAALIARVLVWSNLRGVDSHGVLRIPGYLERVRKGINNPTPNIRTITDLPAAAVLEGDGAFGQVALARAAERLLRDSSAQELADTAWASATAIQGDAPLFAALAWAAERRLGDFSAQQLANTAWAFATAS